MKVVFFAAATAGLVLVAGSNPARNLVLRTEAEAPPASVAAPRTLPGHPAPPAPEDLTKVVQQYCVVCHNDALLTGRVTMQSFAVERAQENTETAERMIRKLRAGMMPPPGAPRPSADTLQALVETLETIVDDAAKAKPYAGTRRFARLNRSEYRRAMKDLLDLEVDPSKWLPPDVLTESYDNMAASQSLTTTLLEAYLRAATDVSLLALGNPDATSLSVYYKNPSEVSQHAWDHIEGTPFGTRGGMVVRHNFPADGEYVFSVETRFGNGNPRHLADEDIDLSIDGESVATLMLPHQGTGLTAPLRTTPILVKAGEHDISAAFVRLVDGSYDDRFRPPEWSASGAAGDGYGITGLAHLTSLAVTGPQKITGVSETPSRQRVLSCRPAAPDQERACAETILTDLAARAYRRPMPKENLAGLLRVYDEGAAQGGFEAGVRAGLQAILASPEFVFRFEREPANLQAGSTFRLSDLDLATRLSFFLWATVPDQELLQLAQRGKLSDEEELEKQVQRMLKDPRSEALATRFAHQWLRLQDVAKVWPEPFLYPNFSKQLADALIGETETFFDHLVRQDRPMLELFNADYTFLNERLAQHYGIENVIGDEFRMVKYPMPERRGILSQGSVLKLTSMADRTSPVLRGKWVMEVLMGTPPPPPPPNVPTLDQTSGAGQGRRLTTRERMETHRKAAVCNSCHSFIDPIGLALSNFDPVGKWRIRENNESLDTRGTFYDGSTISAPNELVSVLMKRPLPLVRNFTNNMLAYAIGRPTTFQDQPTVRAIVRDAEADGYKMSSLIMGIVKSDAFQMRDSQTTTNE